MDHAVKTSTTKAWDKLRFENEELECLYQRYTLKMQRFSVIGVVSLFVIFCMVMATLSFAYTSSFSLYVSKSMVETETETVESLLTRISHLSSVQNIFNSLLCVLFLIILALLQFRVIQDSYLMLLCYGIVLVSSILCIMSMPALSNIIPIDTKEVSWPTSRRQNDK